MLENKLTTKIILVIMAIAIIGCLCLVGLSESLFSNADKGITMDYETELFDTSEIIEINIIMDEDSWQEMLDNAIDEEYYTCDVEINGTKIKNVGIRTKGNTSLSSIVNDPTTSRYSLKLEFDHYVDGQTCFGLDKLILNNNYADATNIKEALIYDIFNFIGADASLYNFASISVNDSYWGVYLALEGIDDSFLLRNYGTEDGELYKPENMEMGNNKRDDTQDLDFPSDKQGFNFSDKDSSSSSQIPGMQNGNIGNQNTNNNQMPSMQDFDFGNMNSASLSQIPGMQNGNMGNQNANNNQMPSMQDFDFGNMDSASLSQIPDMQNDNMGNQNANNNQMPSMQDFDFGNIDSASLSQIPDMQNGNMGNQNTNNNQMPSMQDFDFGNMNSASLSQIPGMPNQDFGNIDISDFDFSKIGNLSNKMSGGGSDLNYTDDDLDSYSAIWEGEVTKTDDADHERVVEALKNISEGTDLEEYMDIDNLLKYMAVHVFSVNDDSLSGSMAHNYYLYENNGQLNLIPWDYNLSFGGMTGSNNASNVINSAIDDAFSITDFFDTLMENTEYHEQYYEYLRQIVEEYVNSGRFDEFYNQTINNIDELVKNDPNAFYSYDEYKEAIETLYTVVKLRSESISLQLSGDIPSYENQRTSSTELVDCTGINLKVLGSMNNGGMSDKGNTGMPGNNEQSDFNPQSNFNFNDDKTKTIPGNIPFQVN